MIDDPSHPDDADRPEADDLPDEEISRYADSEMPTLDPSSVPNTGEGGTVERKSLADRAKVPDRIGPYRVLSVIGFGGMGGVYEAVQEDPRRRVALKIIKPGCVSEQALRRFRFEAQVLGTLQHPGIAQIYEAGTFEDEQGERPYYAMEFIAGAKSITEYATSHDLSVDDRLDLFRKVCDAVHHGHQKGIIHRDLKPDNILVNAAGNPKIIDFGVARTTDADLAVKTMETSFGQILGTLQYMSPEQVEGDPTQLDTRSDVYALGIILYELLCEQLPYDVKQKALHEAIRVIQEDQPDRPSTITRVIRGDIETITLKAIEKQRDRRYDSAAAFGRDIMRFLDSEPIEARRASMGYQLRMFSKRHRVTVSAAVMVVLAISIGLVLFWVSWARAERLNVQLEIEKANVVRERNVAQEQLAETKGVHRDLQGVTLKNIRRLNGALSEKERLARSVVDYFQNLDEDARDEQDLIVLAQARMELAQVLGGRSQDNLGQYDDAVEELKSAIALWNDLVEANPEELGRVQFLALARSRLSDVYQTQERYLEAVRMLELATESLEEVLERQPEDAGTLRVLSNIYQNMA
ncbi:MAG: serine/threonine-protein kinase, partial [Phycisphaerales bacterium]|nr:serine/threonine-protein kinase [Phycisphaerales bacterium]